jgi:cyclophilin family peptidyl-prolyl cis-trans isomerase
MRALAAAVVGVMMLAADLSGQTSVRGQGTLSAESGSLDLSALRDEDALFEQNGVISANGLAFMLDSIDRLGELSAKANARSRREANLIRQTTVRGLGRLERRDLIGPLLQFTDDPVLSETAHLAILLTLRANSRQDQQPEEIRRAVSSLVTTAPPAVLGQLPFSTVEQFETAEARLALVLDSPQGQRAAAARALEALARRNRKLGRLSDETLALLKKAAVWELPVMNRPADEPLARDSFAALMAAGVVDAALIETALGQSSPLYRRLGAFALFGTGATLSAADRTRLVRDALEDRDWTVRYDALRAWVRRETDANGCGPIADALGDSSLHLVLAAIDALADRCITGEEAEPLTARLISELRTPPDIGSWHRETHAVVAAARRVPDRAAMAMGAFRTHNVWQVRMYAARAAEPLKDVFTLEKLAYDTNDNVREATLVPLQRLAGTERSQPAFIAALGRDDYQLVRTAAIGVKGQTSDKYVVAALADALVRITAHKSETSRDTRLELMARLREAGTSQAPAFEKLLSDFDPRIAEEAAAALRGLTGTERAATPRPMPRIDLVDKNTGPLLAARVELDTGRSFDIRFDTSVAPLAYGRIRRLVREKYYDGLTFHRVVPNFVIQGGSPGANEYAGSPRVMRDELSATPHSRGMVGLSTRGHHTGDAQIFVNLADNRMLDFEYTVFGEVALEQMPIVDAIQEGTRITRIRLVPDRDARR